MRRLLRKFSKLLGEERGTTAIEYAIIASMISILIVAGVASIGSNLSSIFTSVSTSM